MKAQPEATEPSGIRLGRIGVYSLLVNLALSGLKLGLAAASGSLALAADAVHSVVDVFASLAVIVGLRISSRKSRSFPYGLYKVENVVSIIIAFLIFLAGYEIVREAFASEAVAALHAPWLVAGVVLTILIPYLFGRYEMRIGRASGSPSLIADGKHYQTDVLSSAIVLVAVVGSYFNLALDRFAALGVVIFIVRAGWELLSDGMRVLLDASLEPETLLRVREILTRSPLVSEVRWVTGRNSGRFRFIEAEITVRTKDLRKAHTVSQQLEAQLRSAVPHVERVLIHYEPAAKSVLRIAVPLADSTETLSPHFGEAPYFALVDVRLADGQVVRQEVLSNPHLDVPKAKGIRVAEWLVAQKVDEVLLREDVKGKGPEYVFSDAGVEVRLTTAVRLSQALAGRVSDDAGDSQA